MAMEADTDAVPDPPFVAESELSLAHERRYGVRAETLSNIRWVAVAGQLFTACPESRGYSIFDLVQYYRDDLLAGKRAVI